MLQQIAGVAYIAMVVSRLIGLLVMRPDAEELAEEKAAESIAAGGAGAVSLEDRAKQEGSMGQFIRRRAASIQLSLAAGALGVLAGIGLGKGAEPPQVDAELAAKKTITIYGSNIADGTIQLPGPQQGEHPEGHLPQGPDRPAVPQAHRRRRALPQGHHERARRLHQARRRRHALRQARRAERLHQAHRSRRALPAAGRAGQLPQARDGGRRFLKLDALNGYLKLDAADARFIKLDQADARYLKLDALTGYVKLDDADARFVKLGALDGYLKLDALNGYVKLTDADGRFLKLDDAGALIDKHLTDNGYLKQSAADGRYLQGDGSVVTGSRLVEDSPEPLLAIGKSIAVTAEPAGGDKGGAIVKLTNLGSRAQEYAGAGFDAAGAPPGGTIPPNGTVAILIGLLAPATVQIVEGEGDGTAVHTLNLTAYEIDGKLQVVGQALSGAPPAPDGLSRACAASSCACARRARGRARRAAAAADRRRSRARRGGRRRRAARARADGPLPPREELVALAGRGAALPRRARRAR